MRGRDPPASTGFSRLREHLLRQQLRQPARCFDFVAHELVVRTSPGDADSFPLADGLSVAAFYERFLALLAGLGIAVEIRPSRSGFP